MTEILEVYSSRKLDFPAVLSIEEAIKHIEDTAFEMIVPHFHYLHWEKIDSSVTYCNRTGNNDFRYEEETDLEMVMHLCHFTLSSSLIRHLPIEPNARINGSMQFWN